MMGTKCSKNELAHLESQRQPRHIRTIFNTIRRNTKSLKGTGATTNKEPIKKKRTETAETQQLIPLSKFLSGENKKNDYTSASERDNTNIMRQKLYRYVYIKCRFSF